MAFLDERRRTVRLLQPALQLKLPLYLLLSGGAFVGVMVAVGQSGLVRPMGFVLAEVSPSLMGAVELVLRDFAILAGAATLSYVLAVLALSVIYVKRLVGPTVAFRRHVESLKNGNYQARVRLRDNDAFTDLADDLNELAGLLEEKKGH